MASLRFAFTQLVCFASPNGSVTWFRWEFSLLVGVVRCDVKRVFEFVSTQDCLITIFPTFFQPSVH